MKRGCNWRQRALVWAGKRESHERDIAWHSGGGGIVERTISRAARDADFLQRLAAGSGAAHAAEQFGSGSGGKAGRVGGLWRDGESSAELGMFSRDCAFAEGAGSG